jgi:microcin C transport system substrate-binding protein
MRITSRTGPGTIPALAVMLVFSLGVAGASGGDNAEPAKTRTSHGLSLFGSLKYPPDFKHFDYVNPDAPKGGDVRLSAIGSFDTLNPFTLKGRPAAGATLIYDQLLASAADEPSSEYGLLAESVEVPEDKSWVAFKLRPEARWHDGKPVTPEDVIFSLEILKTKGQPFYRFYYANVAKAEKTGPRTVKFTFSGAGNRELPLIVGQLVVLPKHYWEGREFEKTTLDSPPGSGPYRIGAVDPGRSFTIERVDDYWGRDLPINRGRYNFDTVRWEYYRDDTVAFEAFKAHGYDFIRENNSKRWATGYDFPAIKSGAAIKEAVRHESPTGLQGFVFNTRRAKFASPKVREALNYAFDFEWSNKNLFYGIYTRTRSYFSNSELASEGLPEGNELALLEPYRDQLPEQVFTQQYHPPTTDGAGNNRANLRTAKALLEQAGWSVIDKKLTNRETGEQMEIEFLLISPAFERVLGPFTQNLKKLGITARIRLVDTAQYQNRVNDFDYDVVVNSWGQSLSPGNEQRDFWSTDAADRNGSRNYAGIKDPVVDALIDKIIFSSDRASLVAATRALDRVLLWGHYAIPNWHTRDFRIAYWNRFSRPKIFSKYRLSFFDTWWVDPEKGERAAAR